MNATKAGNDMYHFVIHYLIEQAFDGIYHLDNGHTTLLEAEFH